MKRVILVFSLALFIICLAAPSVAFAGDNSNRAAAFDRDAQAAEGHSGGLSKSFSPKRTWGKSLRYLFGRYIITRLPGTGIIVIDVPLKDQEGPLGTHIAPWKAQLMNRPEKDEHGWDDNK